MLITEPSISTLEAPVADKPEAVEDFNDATPLPSFGNNALRWRQDRWDAQGSQCRGPDYLECRPLGSAGFRFPDSWLMFL